MMMRLEKRHGGLHGSSRVNVRFMRHLKKQQTAQEGLAKISWLW